MDNIIDLPEVRRGERGGEDLHPDGPKDELRILRIRDLDHVRSLLARYDALDVSKVDTTVFRGHLLQDPNSWFLEVGEDTGLLFFTGLVPYLDGILNILFWDEKLTKERAAAVRKAVVMAATRFNLGRVSCRIKWSNTPMKRFLRQVGFTYEGTVRKGWLDSEGYHDMLLYGIIREEM